MNLTKWQLTAAPFVVALALFGCGGDDDGGPTTEQRPQQEAPQQPEREQTTAQGKQLFVENCGRCHTLSDAGTSGTVGPNLDDLQPDKQRVLDQIETGGSIMPARLVTGQDADDVAQYVSSVAGSQ
jgi:mono/diheme cytochrome c family protein